MQKDTVHGPSFQGYGSFTVFRLIQGKSQKQFDDNILTRHSVHVYL